ncbi:MAG: hypothetical protein RL469_1799 [Pseudomonadota bacterium]|jgi:ABC-type uncharacterized transport system auxiliary subunit|nr:hypothetical protein [Gammaproteobacteria bacterium]
MKKFPARLPVVTLTLVAIASLTFAGCAWQSGSAPTVTYVLRAVPSNTTAPPRVVKPISLKILPAVVAPGYDTDHILLQRPDRSLDFFAASRWAAPIPRLLETLAAEVWRDGGVKTFDVGASMPATHTLRLTVLRFDVDGDPRTGPAAVLVRLRGTLSAQGVRSMQELEAEASVPLGAVRMAEIVVAFEAASNKVLTQMRNQAALDTTVTH